MKLVMDDGARSNEVNVLPVREYQRGDTVLLLHSGRRRSESIEYISNAVKSALPGVQVLVLEEGMTMEVLRRP